MATARQRSASRRNIRKATRARGRKRTMAKAKRATGRARRATTRTTARARRSAARTRRSAARTGRRVVRQAKSIPGRIRQALHEVAEKASDITS